jgi:integrase
MEERTLKNGQTVFDIWIDLGKDSVTGKRVQKTYAFRGGKREAQRELNRLLSEAQAGKAAPPGRTSLGAYLTSWIDAKSDIGAKTKERYAEIITTHLIPNLGHVPLTKISTHDIEGFYRKAQTEGRRDGKGGLSAQTVLHFHRLLHKALADAVKRRKLTQNPCDYVQAPSPEDTDLRVLDEEGTLRLLEEAKGTRLYFPCLIAALTGMRLGEILALKWTDVDLEAGILVVRQSQQETREGLNYKCPKNKRTRTNRIPSLLVEGLRELRQEQEARKEMLGDGYQDRGLIVCQENGEAWKNAVLSKAFEHLALKAGCPEVRFHDLRHGLASQLLKQGHAAHVVSGILGHARVSTTMNIYSHVLNGQAEAAATGLDAAFRAVMEKGSSEPKSAAP